MTTGGLRIYFVLVTAMMMASVCATLATALPPLLFAGPKQDIIEGSSQSTAFDHLTGSFQSEEKEQGVRCIRK